MGMGVVSGTRVSATRAQSARMAMGVSIDEPRTLAARGYGLVGWGRADQETSLPSGAVTLGTGSAETSTAQESVSSTGVMWLAAMS